MADFVQNLWESIFTPGPTPTLLVATNVTFACLQTVLLLLLVVTYSIHFLILSCISAGLWLSINWFAGELQAAQEKEAREKARAQQQQQRGASHHNTTEDSDTEVEQPAVSSKTRPPAKLGSKEVEPVEQPAGSELKQRGPPSSPGSGSGAGVGTGPGTGTKSGVSTEDEWEKISENENEKDK